MSNPQANKLHKEGVDLFRNDNPDGALDKLNKALQLAPEKSRQAAEIYNDLGVVYKELDNLEAGHEALDKAMALFTALDDEKGQAQTLGNRGALLEAEEEYEEAVETYKQSATMFQDLGENDMAMYVWQAVSRLRTRQGQYIAAIGAYEEGVENMPASSFKKRILKQILKAPGSLLGGGGSSPASDEEDNDE